MQILNNVKVLNQSPRMAKKMKPKQSHNKPIMIPNNIPRKYNQKTRLMVLKEVWLPIYIYNAWIHMPGSGPLQMYQC